MEGYVSWVNELTVKEGALETLGEPMEEMVSVPLFLKWAKRSAG